MRQFHKKRKIFKRRPPCFRTFTACPKRPPE